MTKTVTEILKTKYPLVQGPLAWLTNADFVAAVCEAGALGTLGPNAGQTEVTRDPIETAERMRREIRAVREKTDRPFAVNLIMPLDEKGRQTDNPYFVPMLDLIIDEHVPVAAVINEPDEQTFKELKAAGVTIMYREIHPNPESTVKAVNYGADLVVATGMDQGGEVPDTDKGTFSILPSIVDAVDGRVPVLAAGGIVDIRSVRAAQALGAQGVYVGTRFVVSQENPAAQAVKERIVNEHASDLIRFKSIPTDWRSLPTPMVNKVKQLEDNGTSVEDVFKIVGGLKSLRSGMRLGMIDDGMITVNTAIDSIHSILSVQDIVDNLMADFR
jgi:enoyl-[acyl-carrier protein] reductase II